MKTNARRIEFEGCFNFRDLGGWRTDDGRTVRSGRLFRADSVHLMTAADATRARDELGIRTLLDLRHEFEIEMTGRGILADEGLPRHHLSLTSRRFDVIDSEAAPPSGDRSPDTMVANYLAMLDVSSDLFVQAVDAMASDDALPAVFFCAAGKDRTGVLSAVVLGALDVRGEDIVEDYVRTGEFIEDIIGRFAATEGVPEFYKDLPPSNFVPYAETMERVIDGVKQEYGGFAEYLVARGLPRASLDALQSALLTTAG